MVFKSAQRSLFIIPEIQLGTHPIPASNDVVFLGIHLDPSLTFRCHFNHLKQKTAFGIRALIKARPFFSRAALLVLYFAFVHSLISYGIVSWGNTYACHLSSIQHIQNQSIRIVTSSSAQSNAHTLLRFYNILPINTLFQFHLVILFHKLLQNHLAFQFIASDLLQNNNVTRFAANKNFLLPQVHTNYGKKTTAFTAIYFWNDLPSSIKSCISFPLFKKSLKNYFLQ